LSYIHDSAVGVEVEPRGSSELLDVREDRRRHGWVAGGGIAFVVRQIGAYCVEGSDIGQPYPVQQRRCFDDVAAIGSTCGVLECVPNFSGAQIFGDKQVRSKVGAALARASQGVN